MNLATLFKTSRRKESNFNFENTNGSMNKFGINTLTPKFQYKNSKGEMVTLKESAQL